MTEWRQDPRVPYIIAAILGMIAGVAAKQAVSITSGHYPKPISVLADFLVLGIIFLIVMYVHVEYPKITVEGISLLSAALAMWGPRGINALLHKFQKGALSAAEAAARQFIDPVEPVGPPTVSEAKEQERKEAMDPERENRIAKTAPVRRIRDIIPLEGQLPSDEVQLLSEVDKAVPDYQWNGPFGTKKEEKE